MTQPHSQGRRLQRPSWRDARLLVGVLLVLLSILAGSWVVARADNTTPVYVAERPLLPGQEVTSDDVSITSVRLDDALSAYVDATAPWPRNTFVLRMVEPGELVPAESLGTARQAKDKTVAVPVDPAAASILRVGSTVEVWVSARDPKQAGVRYLDPELLLTEAVVAELPQSGGSLSVGVGKAAVAIIVPSTDVSSVISSVDQEARITLVPAPKRHGGD